MSADPRSRRVAVVADSRLEGLTGELDAAGYGVIQLPPQDLGDATVAAWIEQVAEHVAEFVRSGYEVVLADDGTAEAALTAALGELGVATPPPYAVQPPTTSAF